MTPIFRYNVYGSFCIACRIKEGAVDMNKKHVMLTALLLLLLTFAVLAFKPVRAALFPFAANDRETDSHIFDARYVKPGDRIAEMEVTRVDLTEVDGEYLGTVQFRGSALVKGTYLYRQSDPLNGEMLSFYVDEDSSDRIPIMSHDNRDPWFVFTNFEVAKTMFGIPDGADTATGQASVVIDDYFIHHDYKEAYNTATLIEAYVEAVKP